MAFERSNLGSYSCRTNARRLCGETNLRGESTRVESTSGRRDDSGAGLQRQPARSPARPVELSRMMQ